MPSKVPLKITDTKTGEVRVFDYYGPACEWMNSLTGLKLSAGNISSAFNRSGFLADKRFQVVRTDGYVRPKKKHLPERKKLPECDRHKRKNGWLYEQYCCSTNVIVAERKIPWYDEERLEAIKKVIRKMGYFFSYARTDTEDKYYKSKKQTARIELYMKFDEVVEFENKVVEMDRLIAKIGRLWEMPAKASKMPQNELKSQR